MGGKLDWTALPLLVELYGIVDVPVFVAELVAIRDHLEERQRWLTSQSRA